MPDADATFFWHDYETFGAVPRRDRPAQFAGLRTDLALNEVDDPVMLHCRPSPDYLPDPESCLLTGITPQRCAALGVPEHAFAAAIEAQLARPGTIGVGYNSIRFDDEVTRHLLWRNLAEPYAREWQNGCGRWDLLDVMRCAWSLRPDGIEWPRHADGRPSFRLEQLTAANGIAHADAHDALADVRATLGLARRLRDAKPRLWDFCLRLRSRQAVADEIDIARQHGTPFLHLSGRYPAERGCLALVWPLGPHPTHRHELIVWDLAHDPAELFALDAAAIRARLFVRADELPDGTTRLPIKTIHLNKSPIVIGNPKTLTPARGEHWRIDVARALRHAEAAARGAGDFSAVWPAVFERPPRDQPADVDEDLYGGFVGDGDRRTLQRLRGLAPDALAASRPAFADQRLDELLFRYRARNFGATLSDAELTRWQAHCAARLLDGAGGARTLDEFFARVDELGMDADDPGQDLLGELVDYATAIAPERRGPAVAAAIT